MPRMFDDLPHLEWCGQYILGGEEGHTLIPYHSLSKWGRWQARADRCVAWTGGKHKYVSTVFLRIGSPALRRRPAAGFRNHAVRQRQWRRDGAL